MLQILIIEDDPDKRNAVEDVVLSTDVPLERKLTIAKTAFEGLGALAKSHFDLVILDIALPRREGADIDPKAGLDILDELADNPARFRTPTHIVGLTGYPEILQSARGRFASYFLTLALYDPSSTEWSDALRAQLKHISAATEAAADQESLPASDLAIVCALQIELNAVLGLRWEWRQIAMRGDHTIYWEGTYYSQGVRRTAHAALAARMGMPAAACVSSKMIHWFRPRYLCMTGIAAGVPGRTNLGDVIAADPCWDWGSGKWQIAGALSQFSASPYQIGIDPWIREKLRLAATEAEWLKSIDEKWNGAKVSADIKLHVGPLASGSAVLADRTSAERIIQQNRQLLGIDMEAYGVYAAAQEAALPRPIAFAVKSVVDFADGSKNDRFQLFGAYVSAAVLQHIAEMHL